MEKSDGVQKKMDACYERIPCLRVKALRMMMEIILQKYVCLKSKYVNINIKSIVLTVFIQYLWYKIM